MDDLKKIVWLASYPKSGNTWFRAFLTALLDPDGKAPDINSLYPTTIASSRQLFDELAGVASADLTSEEIDHLRPMIYHHNALESEEMIYHKIHDACIVLSDGKPLIPKDVTKAVLYFIRNPLDIVISFANHLCISIDKTIKIMNNPEYAFCSKTDRLHNQLKQRLLTWSGHVRSWVDESGLPLQILRYEDMVANPFEIFSKSTKFIGLSYNDVQLNKSLENGSFSRIQEQEKEKGFHEKGARASNFFRKGTTGEWKNTLTKIQVKRIVRAHGEVMERFGYMDDLKI